MNTSKRNQKPFLLAIAAVLVLALVVSITMVIAIAANTAKPSTVGVSLDGKVNLNFNFTSAQADVVSYKATVGDRSFVVVDTDESDAVSVKVPLMPYEMAEEVTLQHLDAEGNVVAQSTASVLAYAEKVLASEDHAAYHGTVKALLNYGAMAQIDKNYNADKLVNAAISANIVKNDPVKAVATINNVELNETVLNGENFDKASSKVALAIGNGDIALNYTIKYANAGANLYAYVDGAEDGIKLIDNGDGTYSFSINNLSVASFAKVWSIKFSAGEGDDLTTETNVLKYLDWNMNNADKATEQDVCRALFLLYTNAYAYNQALNASATPCTHNNLGYWVSAGTGMVQNVCITCNTEIDAPISDKINAYISGEALAGDRKADSGIYEVSCVDGVYHVVAGEKLNDKGESANTMQDIPLRETYYANADKLNSNEFNPVNNSWNETNKNGTINAGTAEFMVVKMRLTSDRASALTIKMSTTAWTYMNSTGIKDALVASPAYAQNGIFTTANLKKTGNNAWATYVIDLDSYGEKVAADADGNRIIDSLRFDISTNKGDTLDIEYVAFVDDWAEVESLVDGKIVQYVNNEKITTKTFAGAGVLTPDDIVAWSSSSTTGEHVNANGYYQVTGKSDGTIGAVFAVAGADKGGSDVGTTLNVGQGRYFLIKYRSQADNTVRIHMSTTAVSSTNNSSDKDGYGALELNPDGVNVWTYYLLDAASAIFGYDQETLVYKTDDNGDYVIDTFLLEQAQAQHKETTLEIAYMAFLESLEDVDALLAKDADAKSVYTVQKTYTNTYNNNGASNATTERVTEEVKNGMVKHNNGKYAVIDGRETVVCATCGYELKYTMFDAKYLDIMNALTNGNVSMAGTDLHEDYVRLVGNGGNIQKFFFRGDLDSGQINGVAGGNRYVNVGDSQYITIKIRFNDGDDTKVSTPAIWFGLSTIEQNRYVRDGGTVSTTNKTDYGSQSYYSDAKLSLKEDWQVFVIDAEALMSNAYKKTGNDYILDMLRFTSITMSADQSVDVAYIAFAADMDEVAAIIGDDKDIAYKLTSATAMTTVQMPCLFGGEHVVSATLAGDTYTLTCATCGKTFTKTNATTGTKSLDPVWMTSGHSFKQGNYEQRIDDDGTWYYHYKADKTEFEHGWSREGYASDTYKDGRAHVDIGKARYMVVKMRAYKADQVVYFYISSTGYNILDARAAGVTDSAASQVVCSTPKIATIENAGEWVTVYIDLSTLTAYKHTNVETAPNVIRPDATTGTYILDTLYPKCTVGDGGEIDIAYIAFVETEEAAQNLVNAN